MEKYIKLLDDLKENLYLEEGNYGEPILRVKNAITFGRCFPWRGENVFLNDYQYKLMKVLKDLREYQNTGGQTNQRKITLVPLFSPAFLTHELKFRDEFKEKYKNASPLHFSDWEESYTRNDLFELNLEIPNTEEDESKSFSKKLIGYAKFIDAEITEKMKPQKNSFTGKIKRFSFTKFDFPNIEYNVFIKDPRLDIFDNRSFDDIIGIGNSNRDIYNID